MDSQVLSKSVRAVYADKESSGTLQVKYFGRKERLRRAVRTGGICLGVALVCLCIPGAHFVLVPLAIVASPFIIVRSFRVLNSIAGSELRCAACGSALKILTSQERYPMYETCGSCHRENRINLADV